MGAPYYESQYLRAIRSVGQVLEPYDSDNQILAYGFGADIAPPSKNVSHCFPLNFNESQPYVKGLQGLIQSYTDCLKKVQLYGPTYFAEIVATVHGLTSYVWHKKKQTKKKADKTHINNPFLKTPQMHAWRECVFFGLCFVACNGF